MVALGKRESGVQWKKDYDSPFTQLIDRDMAIYRLFGLRREVKVWKLDTFTFYAAKVIEGHKDTMMYDGDDVTVMGGDFIVKQSGEVVFAHRQKGVFDRPQITDLLQCLRAN